MWRHFDRKIERGAWIEQEEKGEEENAGVQPTFSDVRTTHTTTAFLSLSKREATRIPYVRTYMIRVLGALLYFRHFLSFVYTACVTRKYLG